MDFGYTVLGFGIAAWAEMPAMVIAAVAAAPLARKERREFGCSSGFFCDIDTSPFERHASPEEGQEIAQ